MQTAPTPRPGFGRIAAIILTALLALSVLALVLTPAIAPLFLYLPTHDAQARDSLLARDDIEPLTIQSNGAELSGYFLHGSDGPAPLVIYFNGNHENASAFMLELVDTPERLAAFGGCHFAQVDYPSYGLSGGKPGADAYRAMALDVYDALSAREDVTQVIILGYSIGTGPAHFCAANRPVDGLILLAPYASGEDLFNNIIPVFHGPLEALVCYDMPSIDYAAQIAVAPLVFATPEDRLVPYGSTLRLTSVYPAGCEFITVPDIDHKGFLRTPMVLEAIGNHIAAIIAQED